MNEPRLLMKFAEAKQAVLSAAQERKKTILIYSPDLNFCFSLSTVFQDRYEVVTTTDPDFLDSFTTHYATDLVVVDADPSNRMITRFQAMKKRNENIPILVLYVYGPKGVEMDRAIRQHVDAVLYKPFDVDAITERIHQLL
jgi:DNA-binding NtrC family response regulator